MERFFSQRRRAAHGFTLIELLVVIVILGILGTISVGSYRRFFGSGNDSTRYAAVRAVELEIMTSGLSNTEDLYTGLTAGEIEDLLNTNDVNFTARNNICVVIGLGTGPTEASLDNQYFVATWGEQDSTLQPGQSGMLFTGTTEARNVLQNMAVTQSDFACDKTTSTLTSVSGNFGSTGNNRFFMLQSGNQVVPLN
ncbi:type II secretion system protein [Candidatus Peribacteria bacterium]|nr:type II secretion system protein [Candidatus Peribacteria bacterium]